MMPNILIKLGLASAVREFITKTGSVSNLKIDLQIIG
jgi:two-component system NarL family sensor kinase